MNKISVFANFLIDNEETFLRLKDSFFSFNQSNFYSWNINIRGKYKFEVETFLKTYVKKKLKIYFLDSREGWMQDSIKIIEDIESFLIFIWVEDHICLNTKKNFDEIIDEMYENEADILNYSWFHKGRYKAPLKFLKYKKTNNLCIFESNKDNCQLITQNFSDLYYPISLQSIMSKNFFKKNLEISKNKIKYNHKTPFNFEKKFNEIENWNFKNAVLNEELFASIDDDHVCKNSSLISRGIYPNRKSREEMLKDNQNINNFYKTPIYKGIFQVTRSIIKYLIKKFN